MTPGLPRGPAMVALLFALSRAGGQTTDGMISGHVYDRLTGGRIAGATIRLLHLDTGTDSRVETNATGFYAQPRLSPGTYSLRVEKSGYQSLESTELRLFVAGRIDLDLPMRPAGDIYSDKSYFNGWAAGLGRESPPVIHFYAADIETRRPEILPVLGGEAGGHQSAVSYVIDARLLESMPLIGRDAYTALAAIPGVTSDTTTARSLGLSVNGQRPAASNFLLDGLENNNYLLTGPTLTVAPEAIAEYRISTNNFSAEYGATIGFIANVMSRSGGDAWHGIAYSYLKNDALNANDFQRNAAGRARIPVKELQVGASAAGPVSRTLFLALSFEALRFRSRDQERTFRLPNSLFVPRAGSVAEGLLRGFARPAPAAAGGRSTAVTLAPPSSLNQYLALPRLDHVLGDGGQRLMYRVAAARVRRPDLVWTPYPDFVMPLKQDFVNAGVAWIGSIGQNLSAQVRGGVNRDEARFDRPHPEVPFLRSLDNVDLPGSPTFYSFRNLSRSWQMNANLAWVRGKHVVKSGGGLLHRTYSGYLTAGGDGIAQFVNLTDFGNDDPIDVFLSIPRAGDVRAPLDFDRKYRIRHFFGFLQDDIRATPRFTANLGVRYENGASPVNTGHAQDAVIELGGGATLAEGLGGAKWSYPQGGNRSIYPADRNDWAARAGFAWSLGQNARTLIRGGYGIFYDRPFDNLWINLRKNNYAFVGVRRDEGALDYSHGLRSVVGQLTFPASRQDQFRPLLIQPDLRSAYVQSFFAGARVAAHSQFTLELNGLGSLGRKLITTDVVNRPPRANAGLQDLNYRANQGTSDYVALSAVADYRRSAATVRLNYTLSRIHDVQSEPLEGDFFDLRFTQRGGGGTDALFSTFARQYDSSAERGPADFDQRHNFTMLSVWDVPGLWSRNFAGRLSRNWRVAAMGAFRSGFPFSVLAPTAARPGTDVVLRNRADLVDPAALVADRSSVCLPAAAGIRNSPVCGVRILNRAAFRAAQPGTLGNTTRNQFRGPGLFSLDLSLGRSFGAGFLGEGGKIMLRVDAYNVLNHVNLNSPASTRLDQSDFGVALYGREGRSTGFPALTPFLERPRQIQFLLRIHF